MSGRQLALALAIFGAISIGLRLPFLAVPLITDEAGYAYTAHWWSRGLVLYRDLWFDRPQGIFVLFMGIERLLGEDTEAIRLGAALYNAASVPLLYLLARRIAGQRAALGAAGLFAIASASPAIEGFTANGELFMTVPALASLLLAAGRRPFLAGIMLALATVIKPTALPATAPALLVLLMRPASEGRRAAWRALLGLGLRCAAGGLAGAAPFLAHGLLTDPQAYWYAVVGFRVQSHSAFSVGQALVGELAQTAPSVAVALLPLLLLGVLGLRAQGWRTLAGRVGLAWLGGSLLAAAAGGYWYWHYYVGLVPPLAFLAGCGMERLLLAGAGRRQWGAVLLATVAAVGFNARLLGHTPEETSMLLYRRPAYLASRQIAAYLRAHTHEHDRVYATFAQADLYHLSGRRSAGRQLYWTEINRVPGAFESLLAELDDPQRRPLYVVQIDRELEIPGRADPFWHRVEALYRREAVIAGFPIYRLKGTSS